MKDKKTSNFAYLWLSFKAEDDDDAAAGGGASEAGYNSGFGLLLLPLSPYKSFPG